MNYFKYINIKNGSELTWKAELPPYVIKEGHFFAVCSRRGQDLLSIFITLIPFPFSFPIHPSEFYSYLFPLKSSSTLVLSKDALFLQTLQSYSTWVRSCF